LAGSDRHLDEVLQHREGRFAGLLLGLGAPRVSEVIGVRGPVDLGGPEPETDLVGVGLARERERHVRPAMEGVSEGDDAWAARVGARYLDGVLDGLGTAVRQEGLLRAVARRQRIEALGQLYVTGVHADREAQVLELLDLLLDGVHDRGMGVADVHDGDAGREVEVSLTVGVPDVGALTLHRMEGMDACGARSDGGRAAPPQLLVGHKYEASSRGVASRASATSRTRPRTNLGYESNPSSCERLRIERLSACLTSNRSTGRRLGALR